MTLGSALRRLQERHDGALVRLGRWDRVTSLRTKEQAGVEQLLSFSGLGESRKPLSCCARIAHVALGMHLCVHEGWVLLLLLTSNNTFLKPPIICRIMCCSV